MVRNLHSNFCYCLLKQHWISVSFAFSGEQGEILNGLRTGMGIIYAASLSSVFWHNKDLNWVGSWFISANPQLEKKSYLSQNLMKTIHFSVLSETNSGNSFQLI